MLRHPFIVAASALALGLLTAHCGTDNASQFTDGADSGADGGGGNGLSFGDGNGNGNGTGGNGTGSDGGVEICDGIDNDGDGAIDNIDVGHDGICDCLRVATLGKKGTVGDPGVFTRWLDGKSTAGATDLGDQVLTPELLRGFQVIVAQNVYAKSGVNHAYSDAEKTALADWVKAGGGFLTLTGYDDTGEVVNVNKLLSSFGLSYKSAAILSKPTASTVAITNWTANSPVTEGIKGVGVDNGHEADGDGQTLAQQTKDNVNYVLLKGKPVDKGHVLVWGDEWITFDSQWNTQTDRDYQVERFWLNMIKWLTPATECQVPIPSTVK